MPESSKDLKTLLFLCKDNHSTSRLAEIVFENEGQKMEVAWTAKSAGFEVNDGNHGPMCASALESLQSIGANDTQRSTREPVKVTDADLKTADLVIVLRKKGEPDFLRHQFPSWRGNVEVWELPADVLPSIQSNVKNLLIKLILKGGKRTPIAPAPTTTQNQSSTPAAKANVRVQLESKGRGGKKVTVITGLPQNETYLSELATKLKQACGTGGTVKDGCIEIQGDQCKRILEELSKHGYKAKRSGG